MDAMSQLDRAKLMAQEERIALREIELIKFRDTATPLVLKLTTGESLEGVIGWYDEQAIHLVQMGKEEVTVYCRAIAYYKARS